MMREERYAVAVADAFSRRLGGKQIGVCTLMGGLNAAGIGWRTVLWPRPLRTPRRSWSLPLGSVREAVTIPTMISRTRSNL